jgi:hypothetical protein
MKKTSHLGYWILLVFMFLGTPAFGQAKDDAAQLRAQIDQLTKEEMNIALTIQRASPDIPLGSNPQTTLVQAENALESDVIANNLQRSSVVDPKCKRTVSPNELAAAENECDAVLEPFNKHTAELKARAVQLQHLHQLSDQIQGIHLKLAGLYGVQCGECREDDDCWRRCFDGSKNHTKPVSVAVGTAFSSTEAKAERDKKAIEAYLNSGSIPTTAVKVWTKPPPAPVH